MTTDLTIASRFRGPAKSGNGGYTAGSLAERVPPPDDPETVPTVAVTLRRPPPLDVPMPVTQLAAGDPGNGTGGPLTVLSFDGAPVAEARVVDADLVPVDEVGAEAAAAAMAGYPGLRVHPFAGCFACGPDRAEGDGLRIFPGPVTAEDRGLVASLWTPHESLAESSDLVDEGVVRVGVGTTWAALDCVGGWSEDLEGRPMVLGRMTARVDALPVVGDRHVVVGRRLRAEGRKTFTASTLYDADGRVVATAEHVWIAVDPDAFNS
jgi:hypothetical protein